MSWTKCIALIALAFQMAALIGWLRPTIHKNIPAWVYGSVLLGLASMIAHRVADISAPHPGLFGPVTAVMIGIVAFISVNHTVRSVKQSATLEAAAQAQAKLIEELRQQVESRGNIAETLAVHLSNLRGEIDYYKQQADKHGLPHFHRD